MMLVGSWKQLPNIDRFAMAVRSANQARDARRFDEGALHYAEALVLQPDAIHLSVQLGHCLKEIGRFDEARSAYHAFRNARPDDADIYLQIGHLEKRAGDKQSAIDAYAVAASLSDDRSLIGAEARREIEWLGAIKDIVLFEQGMSHLREREFEGAYCALTASVDHDQPGWLAVLVGHSCKETGRFAEARRWYEAQLAYATPHRQSAPDLWFDAVRQLAAFEALERQHLSAFRLLTQAANILDQEPGSDREKIDALWSAAQSHLAYITRAVYLA